MPGALGASKFKLLVWIPAIARSVEIHHQHALRTKLLPWYKMENKPTSWILLIQFFSNYSATPAQASQSQSLNENEILENQKKKQVDAKATAKAAKDSAAAEHRAKRAEEKARKEKEKEQEREREKERKEEVVTDKQRAEKAVQRQDRPRTPSPTPCSPSPVFNLTDDPETQPTGLPATAVAGKPASACGAASLLRDVREDDLQSQPSTSSDRPGSRSCFTHVFVNNSSARSQRLSKALH